MSDPLTAEQELAALLADLFSADEILQLAEGVLGFRFVRRLRVDAPASEFAAAVAAEALRTGKERALLHYLAVEKPDADHAVFRLRALYFRAWKSNADVFLALDATATEEAQAVTWSLEGADFTVSLADGIRREDERGAEYIRRAQEAMGRSRCLLVLVGEVLLQSPDAWQWQALGAARARGQPTLVGVVGRVDDADFPSNVADEVVDLRPLSRGSTPDSRAALRVLILAIQRAFGRAREGSPPAKPSVVVGAPTLWTRPRPPRVIRGLGFALLLAGLAMPWMVWAAGWLDVSGSEVAPRVVARPTKPPVAPVEPVEEPPAPALMKPDRVADATSLRPALMRVPAGTFTMGSPDGEGHDDEHPAHEVTLPSFLVCATEVTQAHYKAVTGESPSVCDLGCGDNHPVQNVSWNDACAYMNQLTARENAARPASEPPLTPCYVERDGSWAWTDLDCTGYRLPTEAEWEYFARAGTRGDYSFEGGEAKLGDHAWFRDNAGNKVHAVGEKLPNPLGLFDVHGNVWEWCWDRYGSYSSEPSAMPLGTGSGEDRVLRGGSFLSTARNLRSADRVRSDPSFRNWVDGFRCVRSSPSSVDP